MILFQDLYDIDELVEILVQGAAFLGGDPTDKMCWLVPRELVTRYWYLTSSSHELNVIGSPKAHARIAAMNNNAGHITVPVSPTMEVEQQHNTQYFANQVPSSDQTFYNQQNRYHPQ